MSKPIKFKRRKSWNEFGHSHYLTFSTYPKKPYLVDQRICKYLANSVNNAAKEHNFAVLAYVFMPDHVHMIIHPINEVYDMAIILQAMKQGSSMRAMNKGWIPTKLWEPGGGYDSNITHLQARIEAIKYIHENPVRKGMVEESWRFRWSSANWRLTGEQGDIECVHIGELWDS